MDALNLVTPEEVMLQLATRVRDLRLQRRWKQSTLAVRAGVAERTVRGFERTGRGSVATLLRICHALGRLDEFSALLEPARARSLAELEARDAAKRRRPKRGVR